MADSSTIVDLMKDAIAGIRSIAEVDIIVGKPIEVSGATIIPVSKMSVGFGTGGSDYPVKNDVKGAPFGGGGGGGVTVTPVAFLVVSQLGEVQMLQVTASGKGGGFAEALPELLDKVQGMISASKEKKKAEKAASAAVEKEFEKR